MDDLDLFAIGRAEDYLRQAMLRHVQRTSGVISDQDARDYSIVGMVRQVFENRGLPKKGLEREAHEGMAKILGPLAHQGQFYVPPAVLNARDLTAGVASAGGYLVGNSIPSFAGALHNRSLVRQLGVTVIGGLTGNITIGKLSSLGNATWLSTEGAPITEASPATGQVAFTPKTVGGYVEMSRQFLLQGGPQVEALFRADLATVITTSVDAAVMAGSGASGQPLGVVNVPGIGAASGASLGYPALVAAQATMANANAIIEPGKLGLATTPSVAELLMQRSRFSNSDTPVWTGSVPDGVVVGARAMSTKNCPAGKAILADWSQIVLAEWGTLVIEVNPFADFPAGIIGLRALWTVDVGVRHPASVFAFTAVS